VAVPERVAEAVAELNPDVLVLDLVLEGGTSLHLIQQLRRSHPDLRIVLYSGYVGSVVLGEARRRGAAACVAKGGDYENLMDAIRGFLPPPVAVYDTPPH
jgi:DNA-binding NarL/FixJ family response regulator